MYNNCKSTYALIMTMGGNSSKYLLSVYCVPGPYSQEGPYYYTLSYR